MQYILMYSNTCIAFRGICFMRKQLNGPDDLLTMPSLLGRLFRLASNGTDTFEYDLLAKPGADPNTKPSNPYIDMTKGM